MYKYETQYDSPNFTPESKSATFFGGKRVVSGITIHHWGDPATTPKYHGVINWLTNRNSGVSAHYVAEAGRVACLVNVRDVAWHAGNPIGNRTTVGIEMNPRASKGDIETCAELVADLRMVYGDVMLYAHNYWANTLCPGRYDVYAIDKRSYQILKEKYNKVF